MKEKIIQFLAETKYQNMGPTDQSKGLPHPPLFTLHEGDTIKLPKVESFSAPTLSLHEAIMQRRSHRKYSFEPITLEELSYALFSTQGVKKVIEGKATFRTVPSAGARHAFETYILINFMAELASGLYVYDPINHALINVNTYDNVKEPLLLGCLNQRMAIEASVTFFWVADMYRMSYRYGERGFRYLHLDAGHIVQNLYLVAEAIHAGTCAIAAFDDDIVNKTLGLNENNQAVLYIAPLGKKAE